MDLCLTANDFTWYELLSTQEVFELGRYQDHCLASRNHYHDDLDAGFLSIYACYRDDVPVMFAVTMCTVLLEMGVAKSHPPPQQYVGATLDFINSEHVTTVWDVDGNIHEAGIILVNGDWVSVRDLPEGLVVNHTLNLNNCNACHKLPANLTIHGDLKICKTQINKLPEGLVVDGEIDTRYSLIHETR